MNRNLQIVAVVEATAVVCGQKPIVERTVACPRETAGIKRNPTKDSEALPKSSAFLL